jgi:sugar phosphate isomerase/epimerase
MEEERFRRLRVLFGMFDAEGLVPVHENCMNYGGMGWQYTLKLVENVPGLKLVFDTGNPVLDDDMAKPEPYPRQSSWEFYTKVRDHIAYVHVKDGIFDEKSRETTFTWPGEGSGDVRRIVRDLLENGYDGGFSIEPHLKVVAHDDSVTATAQARYDAYVEYGRRIGAIIREIEAEL